MTQLTKLGDVAKYLRAGDTFAWEGATRTVRDLRYFHAHGWHMGEEVELVNPRWVPIAVGEPFGAGELIRRDAVWETEQEGTIMLPNTFRLCRETNGHLEPVRAETREVPTDGLPHLVKGSELRVGDRVRFVACEGLSAEHATGANAARPNGIIIGERDREGDPEWLDTEGEWIVKDSWSVELLSRATPPYRVATRADVRAGMRVAFHTGLGWFGPYPVTRVVEGWAEVDDGTEREDSLPVSNASTSLPVRIYDQPEATTTPQPDHDRLRREWDYLAERTPWEAMATIHEQRGDSVLFSKPETLRKVANLAFEQALRKENRTHGTRHLLIVISPDADRPVELFAEALNGAAYRAKCAEIWPVAVKEPEPTRACAVCGAMCGGSAIKCGDCLMALDRMARADAAEHRAEGRFRGLAPAPDNLTPAQRYHLADDIDVYGIPGGHH